MECGGVMSGLDGGKGLINGRAAVEEGVEAEVSRVVKVTLAG